MNESISAADLVDQEEALGILRRLTQSFQLVDSVLANKDCGTIWVVFGADDCRLPQLDHFDTVQELCTFIMEQRAKQIAHPEVRLWMHIFYGTRWTIQKGKVWQLFDGKQLMPISGSEFVPMMDDSGSLLERTDLDLVLAAGAPLLMEQPVGAEQSIVHIAPEDDDDEYDEAPEGEDPELT